MRKQFKLILKFWGIKTFGMKKFARKNRVVQGDRVIEGRVIYTYRLLPRGELQIMSTIEG